MTKIETFETDPEDLLSIAWSRFDESRLEDAIGLARQALQRCPEKHADNSAALAWFLLSVDSTDEAETLLESALTLYPDHAPLHWYLGLLRFRERRLDEASKELALAVTLNPKLDEAATSLAWILCDLQRFEDAARYAQLALAIKVTPVRLAQLGWIKFCLADFDEAVAQLSKALSLEPQRTETRCHLSAALRRMGKVDEALRLLVDGLTFTPTATDLLQQQILLLIDLQRPQEARDACQRLLQQQPQEGTSWYLLAKVLVLRKHNGLAGRALIRAQRLAHEQIDLWQKIGWLALEIGNLRTARIAAERVLALAPRDSNSDILAALVFEASGDLPCASQHAEQAVARTKHSAHAWRALAQIRVRQSRLNDAEAALQTALEVEPHNASETYHQLGWLCFTDHRYEAAIAAFSAAVKSVPLNAAAWYGLAQAYRADSQFPEALRAIRETLRLRNDPNDLILRGQIIREQVYYYLNKKWNDLNGPPQPHVVSYPPAPVSNTKVLPPPKKVTNAGLWGTANVAIAQTSKPYDYVVCSLSTKSHTPLMATMARSVRKHFTGKIYLLVVDSEEPGLIPDDTTLVRLSDVIESSVWQEMVGRYNILELCCALKSYLMRFVATTVGGPVIYLDADTYLLAPLGPLLPQSPDFSVLLTPHLFTPLSNNYQTEEIGMLSVGVYNGGMIGVGLGADGIKFLDWWTDRVTRFAYDSREQGIFTDQKWLDLVPCYFRDVHISRASGLNVGHWRVCSEHDFEEDASGRLRFCGELVVHMHMSGFKPNRPELLSQHILPPVIPDSPLGRFLQQYAREVIQNKR